MPRPPLRHRGAPGRSAGVSRVDVARRVPTSAEKSPGASESRQGSALCSAAALGLLPFPEGADYAAYQLAVDVPYQGSEHQPLHSDVVRAVDAGLDVEPPSMISVNFPLVDIHEENGPLEILPGSQEVSLTAAPALLAKRHLRRVLLSRGDIVL